MKLPLLNNIGIASPCSASWDGMVGDDRKRYCGSCEKNVYNLSAMTELEAQQFIAETEGEDVCVRLYRRKDGTVINADCPVGIRRKRVTRFAAAALAFGGAGLAIANVAPAAEPEPCEIPAAQLEKKRDKQRKQRNDRVANHDGGNMQTLTEGLSKVYNKLFGEEEPPTATMGKISPPPTTTGTTPAVPTHRAVMGRMVRPPRTTKKSTP